MIHHFASTEASAWPLPRFTLADLPTSHPHSVTVIHQTAGFTCFVTPIVIALDSSVIFKLIPIVYAFRPRLRGRLTQGRRALPWKPWAYGEGHSHPLYRVLMPCIFTSMRSSAPYGTPSMHILRSPTTCTCVQIRDFGSMLSPEYFRRKISRLVSCYALFKWLLPLSQHPNCF